jgi:hypothetical protein
LAVWDSPDWWSLESKGSFTNFYDVILCFSFKKFQQDDTVQYFIISCKSLYMFRAYPMPIIRSSINCIHSIWGRQSVCVQPSSWMSQNSCLIEDSKSGLACISMVFLRIQSISLS